MDAVLSTTEELLADDAGIPEYERQAAQQRLERSNIAVLVATLLCVLMGLIVLGSVIWGPVPAIAGFRVVVMILFGLVLLGLTTVTQVSTQQGPRMPSPSWHATAAVAAGPAAEGTEPCPTMSIPTTLRRHCGACVPILKTSNSSHRESTETADTERSPPETRVTELGQQLKHLSDQAAALERRARQDSTSTAEFATISNQERQLADSARRSNELNRRLLSQTSRAQKEHRIAAIERAEAELGQREHELVQAACALLCATTPSSMGRGVATTS